MLLTGIVEVDDAIGRGAGAHGDSMESVAQPYSMEYSYGIRVWLHAAAIVVARRLEPL